MTTQGHDTLLLIATRSGDFFYQSGYAAIVARVAGVKSPPLRAEPGWNKIRYQYKNLLAKLSLEVRPLSVDWDFLEGQFHSDVERAQLLLNEKY